MATFTRPYTAENAFGVTGLIKSATNCLYLTSCCVKSQTMCQLKRQWPLLASSSAMIQQVLDLSYNLTVFLRTCSHPKINLSGTELSQFLTPLFGSESSVESTLLENGFDVEALKIAVNGKDGRQLMADIGILYGPFLKIRNALHVQV